MLVFSKHFTCLDICKNHETWRYKVSEEHENVSHFKISKVGNSLKNLFIATENHPHNRGYLAIAAAHLKIRERSLFALIQQAGVPQTPHRAQH